MKRNYHKFAIKPFLEINVKITTECALQLNQNLHKQTDNWSMGGPFSVT